MNLESLLVPQVKLSEERPIDENDYNLPRRPTYEADLKQEVEQDF